MLGCQAKGKPVPDQIVAPLEDMSALLKDPPALRRRFEEDGYLFLRGALDRDQVLAARREILARLVEVGEVVPGSDGVFTGSSKRKEVVGDLGRFWKSVSEGAALRRVSHGHGLGRVLEILIGKKARPQDYLFLRAGVVGRATGLHYDYPFFTRAHDQVYTVWVPIGDVPVADGPLVVVSSSACSPRTARSTIIRPRTACGFPATCAGSRPSCPSMPAISAPTPPAPPAPATPN